jgi:hypothetical protein
MAAPPPLLLMVPVLVIVTGLPVIVAVLLADRMVPVLVMVPL